MNSHSAFSLYVVRGCSKRRKCTVTNARCPFPNEFRLSSVSSVRTINPSRELSMGTLGHPGTSDKRKETYSPSSEDFLPTSLFVSSRDKNINSSVSGSSSSMHYSDTNASSRRHSNNKWKRPTLYNDSSPLSSENPQTPSSSIPDSPQELYVALLRIAQSVAKKSSHESFQKNNWNERGSSNSNHKHIQAVETPPTEMGTLSCSASTLVDSKSTQPDFFSKELSVNRRCGNSLHWKKNTSQSFLKKRKEEKGIASEESFSRKNVQKRDNAVTVSSSVGDDKLHSATFSFLTPSPKNLLERLLLQHRHRKEQHPSPAMTREKRGNEPGRLRSQDGSSLHQQHYSHHPVDKVGLHCGGSEAGEGEGEFSLPELGKNKKTILARHVKQDGDKINASPLSSSLRMSTWCYQTPNTLQSLPSPPSSAMKAFYLFTEAVSRHGVTPTTQHFNVLLVLAMAGMDWKLVDRIEQLHIGLLSAISERQEAIEKILFSEKEENDAKCSFYASYMKDNFGSLLDGEEAQNLVVLEEKGGKELDTMVQTQQDMSNEAVRVSFEVLHEIPSESLTSSVVTPSPTKMASIGLSSPDATTRAFSPPSPFSFSIFSSCISQLRASLYDVEMAMSPNRSTFELLMEAQRCRARMMKSTKHHVSSCTRDSTSPSATASSMSSVICYNNPTHSDTGHVGVVGHTCREGAAWAVLDLLEVWQRTGVALTERGVWMAMEAYDTLLTQRPSSLTVEDMWVLKLFQEANKVDCGGGKNVVPEEAAALPSTGSTTRYPSSSSNSITIGEARERYYGGKDMWQRYSIRQAAIGEGMLSDRLCSSTSSELGNPSLGAPPSPPPNPKAVMLSSFPLPSSGGNARRKMETKPEEQLIWKAAYTLFASFYRQQGGTAPFSLSSFSSGATADPLWSTQNAHLYPHCYPLALLHKGAAPSPFSPSSRSSLFFPLEREVGEITAGDAFLLSHPEVSSIGFPSPHLLDSPREWSTMTLPISFLALYHLLRILYEAEQYNLVIQEYLAYERRMISLEGSDDGKGWWWKRDRRTIEESGMEDMDSVESSFLSWEQVGVVPENATFSGFLASPSQTVLSPTANRHKGWEVWLLVVYSARRIGDWKVSYRVWMSAFTQAVVEAAAASGAPHRSPDPFLSFSTFPLTVFSSSSSSCTASETTEMPSSALLQLEAVPLWMRQYLPLLLQAHLHTLRRVGRYAEVVRFYRQVIKDTNTQWKEEGRKEYITEVENSVHRHHGYPYLPAVSETASTRSSSSWLWTSRALLLVAQAAVATHKEKLLFSLCGIEVHGKEVVWSPIFFSTGGYFSFEEGEAGMLNRVQWKTTSDAFSSETNVLGPALWRYPLWRKCPEHHASSNSSSCMQGSSGSHRQGHFPPSQTQRFNRKENDGSGSAWNFVPIEVFSLALGVLHHQLMSVRSCFRNHTLSKVMTREARSSHELETAVQKKEILALTLYYTFLITHSPSSVILKQTIGVEKEDQTPMCMIKLLRLYHQLMDIFYGLDCSGIVIHVHGENRRPNGKRRAISKTGLEEQRQLLHAVEAVYAIWGNVMGVVEEVRSVSGPSSLLSHILLYDLMYRCRAFAIHLTTAHLFSKTTTASQDSEFMWEDKTVSEENPWVYYTQLPVEAVGSHSSRNNSSSSDETYVEMRGILQKIESEVSVQLIQSLNVDLLAEGPSVAEKTVLAKGSDTACRAAQSPSWSAPREEMEPFSDSITSIALKMACNALLLYSPSFKGHSEVVMTILEKAEQYSLFSPCEVGCLSHRARKVATAQVKADYLSSFRTVEQKSGKHVVEESLTSEGDLENTFSLVTPILRENALASTNPSFSPSSARDVLWKMVHSTPSHPITTSNQDSSLSSSIGICLPSSSSEKTLFSIANLLMSALKQEVMDTQGKGKNAFSPSKRETRPSSYPSLSSSLSFSSLSHCIQKHDSIKNELVKVLFEKLLKALRKTLHEVSYGDSTSTIESSKKSPFFKTVFAHAVIHSIIEMISLQGSLHQSYWSLCITLLLEFLPPPTAPLKSTSMSTNCATSSSSNASVKLGRNEASPRHASSILHADEETLRCLRRFLRFSGKNGNMLPFVEKLAREWMRIASRTVHCDVKPEGKPEGGMLKSTPNEVHRDASDGDDYWRDNSEAMAPNRSTVHTEAFTEFGLDIVVWCCRHRSSGKWLLFSCMNWFQQVLLQYHNESKTTTKNNGNSSRRSCLPSVLTSVAVIVCQALSSGNHEEVLLRGWPVIQNILESFLCPQILQIVTPGNTLSSTCADDSLGISKAKRVRKEATLLNKDVVFLDNIVAILVKLQQTFHYQIVQAPLDIISQHAPDFPFYPPGVALSKKHQSHSHSLSHSRPTKKTFSPLSLQVLSSAVTSYLCICEKIMSAAIVWQTLGLHSTPLSLSRGQSSLPSTDHVYLSLLRKLIHCQWDLLYSSFVQKQVLHWWYRKGEIDPVYGKDSDHGALSLSQVAYSSAGTIHSRRGKQAHEISIPTDYNPSTGRSTSSDASNSKLSSLSLSICGIENLRSRLRQLLWVEHYFLLTVEVDPLMRSRETPALSTSVPSQDSFSLYSIHFQQWCIMMVYTLYHTQSSPPGDSMADTERDVTAEVVEALVRDVVSVATVIQGLYNDHFLWQKERQKKCGQSDLNAKERNLRHKKEEQQGQASHASSAVINTEADGMLRRSHRSFRELSTPTRHSSSFCFFLSMVESFSSYFVEHSNFLDYGNDLPNTVHDGSMKPCIYCASPSSTPTQRKKGKTALLELFSSPQCMLLWLSAFSVPPIGNRTNPRNPGWWLFPLQEAGSRLLDILLAELDFSEIDEHKRISKVHTRPVPGAVTLPSSLSALRALAWPSSPSFFFRVMGAPLLVFICTQDINFLPHSNASNVHSNTNSTSVSSSVAHRPLSGSPSLPIRHPSTPHWMPNSTPIDFLKHFFCFVLQEFILQNEQWSKVYDPLVLWDTSPVIHLLRLWSTQINDPKHSFSFSSTIPFSSSSMDESLMEKEVIRLFFQSLSYGYLEDMSKLGKQEGDGKKEGGIALDGKVDQKEKQRLKKILWKLLARFPSVAGKSLRDEFFPKKGFFSFPSDATVSPLAHPYSHHQAQKVQLQQRAIALRKRGITFFFLDIIHSYARVKVGGSSYFTSSPQKQSEEDDHLPGDSQIPSTEAPPVSLVRSAVAWLLLCQGTDEHPCLGCELPVSPLLPVGYAEHVFSFTGAKIKSLEEITALDDLLFATWMVSSPSSLSVKAARSGITLAYKHDSIKEDCPSMVMPVLHYPVDEASSSFDQENSVDNQRRTPPPVSSLMSWLSPPLLLPQTAKDILERLVLRSLPPPLIAGSSSALPLSQAFLSTSVYFSGPALRQLLLVAGVPCTSSSSPSFSATLSSFSTKSDMNSFPSSVFFPKSLSPSVHKSHWIQEEKEKCCKEQERLKVYDISMKEIQEENGKKPRTSSSTYSTKIQNPHAYGLRFLEEVVHRILSIETHAVMKELSLDNSMKRGRRSSAKYNEGDGALVEAFLSFPLSIRQSKQAEEKASSSSAPVMLELSPLDQCTSWSEVLHQLREKILPFLLPSSPFLKETQMVSSLTDTEKSPSLVSFSYMSTEALCRALLTTLQNVLQQPCWVEKNKKGEIHLDERLAMVSSLLILLEFISPLSASPQHRAFFSPSASYFFGPNVSVFMRFYLLPWLYVKRQELCSALQNASKNKVDKVKKAPPRTKAELPSDGAFTVSSPAPFTAPIHTHSPSRMPPSHFSNVELKESKDGKEADCLWSNEKNRDAHVIHNGLYAPSTMGHDGTNVMFLEGRYTGDKSLTSSVGYSVSCWLHFLSQLMKNVLSAVHFFQWWNDSDYTILRRLGSSISGGKPSTGASPYSHMESALSHDARAVQVAVLRFLLFSLTAGESSLITFAKSTFFFGTHPAMVSFPTAEMHLEKHVKSSISSLWNDLQEAYRLFTRMHCTSMLYEREVSCPGMLSHEGKIGSRGNFSFLGWLQCGLLLGMWREMLTVLPHLTNTNLQRSSSVSDMVVPRESRILLHVEEWEVRMRSFLIAVLLAKCMSRSTTSSLYKSITSPSGMSFQGETTGSSSSRILNSNKTKYDNSATSGYHLLMRLFAPSSFSPTTISCSSHDFFRSEDEHAHGLPYQQYWLKLHDQILDLSTKMERVIAEASITSTHNSEVSETVGKGEERERSKWRERRIPLKDRAESLDPSPFLSRINRLYRAHPFHVVARWTQESNQAQLDITKEDSPSVFSSLPALWLGGFVRPIDRKRCCSLSALLCERKGPDQSSSAQEDIRSTEKWEDAINHLTHASMEEYAYLRVYESSFGSEKKNALKRSRGHSHIGSGAGGEGRSRVIKEEKKDENANVIAAGEGLPRICASWTSLQAHLSSVPPRRLYLLLLSLASATTPTEKVETLDSTALFPIPVLASVSPPFPHTVHFISPRWTEAAAAACNSWRELFFLLRASLSTLVRTDCKATPVQHLMMQLLLERLRSSASPYSQGVLSLELNVSMMGNEVNFFMHKSELVILEEEKSSQKKPATLSTSVTSLRSSNRGKGMGKIGQGKDQNTLYPSQIFSSFPSPRLLLSAVFKSSAVQPLKGLPAIVGYCYLYCCGNNVPQQEKKVNGLRNRSVHSTAFCYDYLLPRLPQRLITEMLRHSVYHPSLSEALYQVFLRQRYKRLEGIHPFLSLLRAAKKSLHVDPQVNHNEKIIENHQSSLSNIVDDKHQKFIVAISLLLLSMDGYFFSLSGNFLLPSLLTGLQNLSKNENKNFNKKNFQELLSSLSRKLKWYLREAPISTQAFGSLPPFNGVTTISLNGQRMMWKAFVNACRSISCDPLKKNNRSIRKNSSENSSDPDGENTYKIVIGKQKEFPPPSSPDSVSLLGRVIITEIVSYFRRDGWISDAEELMVNVFIESTDP